MSALRMTSKMRESLAELYVASENVCFLAFSTALALERRHLVFIPKIPSRLTSGGNFPRYKVRVTQFGKQWCEQYLPITGGCSDGA